MKTAAQLAQEWQIPEPDAQTVLDLVEGRQKFKTLDPARIPNTLKWIGKCYHEPRLADKKLEACNEFMRGHGIEGITPEGQVYPVAAFVNQGDAYALTVLLDIEENELLLTSWGDWLGTWEEMNRDETEDEQDE